MAEGAQVCWEARRKYARYWRGVIDVSVLELAIEVGKRAVADGACDVGDGLLGARQSRAGVSNANPRNVLRHGAPRMFPERAVKARHTERRHIRERLQCEFVCVVLVDVREDAVDPVPVVGLFARTTKGVAR